MDSLSHLLALLAPRCEVNLHCRFGGRWQAGHQQMRSGVVPWHVVLRGEGLNGWRRKRTQTSGRCLALTLTAFRFSGSRYF